MTAENALEEQIRHARSLLDLIGEERELLRRRDLLALEAVGARKAGVLARLDALASAATALREAPGEQGPLLDELAELARAIRHENRVNGAMIDAVQRHFERTVDLLMGRDASESLYTHLGKLTALSKRRYWSIA